MPAPVDPSRARDALKTALESWKKGDAIDALKSGSPPIVAQDFDWMAGHRLVGYEVTGDGKDDDANLRIPVDLTLRTAQGQGGQEERLLRRRHEPGAHRLPRVQLAGEAIVPSQPHMRNFDVNDA